MLIKAVRMVEIVPNLVHCCAYRGQHPTSAMRLACSFSVLYQSCLYDSHLKPCSIISLPSPAAGPVLVAPPPYMTQDEFSGELAQCRLRCT